MRATSRLSSPAWFAQPMKTSSTSAASTPCVATSCASTWAARSSGRTPASCPPWRPSGVRSAPAITASLMPGPLRTARRCGPRPIPGPDAGATSTSTRPPSRTANVAASVTMRSAGRSAVSGSPHVVHQLGLAVLREVGRRGDHAARADEQVHRPADAEDRAAGQRPVGDPAAGVDLQRAQDRGRRRGRRGSARRTPSSRSTTRPGSEVIGSLPALTSAGSISPSAGAGPTPSIPFSVCSTTPLPSPRKSATSVGIPMPRLTTSPSWRCAATRRAMSCCTLTASARGGRRAGAGSRRPPGRSRRPGRSHRPGR